MRIIFGILLGLLVCMSCGKDTKRSRDIANTEVQLNLIRFDSLFAEATPASLPALKSAFPMFFPPQYPDSVWVNRLQDSLQQVMQEEVLKTFPNTSELKADLEQLYKHIKYYDATFQLPKVYTLLNDVDYNNRILVADSLVCIGLDCYLGSKHPFYQGLPSYVSTQLHAKQIVPDMAKALAKKKVVFPTSRIFLAQLVYYGKLLYTASVWVPDALPSEIIGYSPEAYLWAKDNEIEIWRYFVENELLYSTDAKLLNRFIFPAPFSKFYLEVDNESPGRIGQYMGWQIVKAYMQRENVDLSTLWKTPAEIIFKNAKYKPKK